MAAPAEIANIRIVPSEEPETTREPQGEKATERVALVCAFKKEGEQDSPSTSHIPMFASPEPETSFEPSGEKATDKMPWFRRLGVSCVSIA